MALLALEADWLRQGEQEHLRVFYSPSVVLRFNGPGTLMIDHLDRALYICRYLLGTSQYALVYDGKSNGGLVGFADSDWASDPVTRKSTTGYLVKLTNGVFCWNSCVQKSIALSSTEAEYMSLSDVSRQLADNWFGSNHSSMSSE